MFLSRKYVQDVNGAYGAVVQSFQVDIHESGITLKARVRIPSALTVKLSRAVGTGTTPTEKRS